MSKHTLAHVTHEAVEKLGGIGTVLEGLITSPVYQKHVGRSILVGPCQTHVAVDPQKRLGDEGTVLYSSVDQIDELGLGARLRPIEWAFNTPIVYGKRTFAVPGDTRRGEADVLMIDIFNISHDRLSLFKFRLNERFGLDSMKYDHEWGYEEYIRLAEPAFYALNALLADDEKPCIVLSHEFMGMGTALKCIMDGQDDFRTIFHAHECATARYIVEHHDGHDTMFYNVLRQARARGLYVADVFADRIAGHFRHAIISLSHCCDAVMAVGDYTAEEMHFLGPHFDHHDIELVYNGVPAFPVTLRKRNASRKLLVEYSQKLVGYAPDVLLTHVTRPVISKGMWRDVQVCGELDRHFADAGLKGVLYILTTGGGVRRPQDVAHMEAEYGWPRDHRFGYPDLVGPEEDLWRMIEPFNREHPNVQIVLVNQFGWSRDRIGKRLPANMDIADLRRAADVEFGMATYEPFGISPLEPLGSGAVCVISNVCGCEGLVEYVAKARPVDNVLVADYTKLERERSIDELLRMGRDERDRLERIESARIAAELMRRIPRNNEARTALIESGQKLVKKMGWDQVVQHKLLGVLERITNGRH